MPALHVEKLEYGIVARWSEMHNKQGSNLHVIHQPSWAFCVCSLSISAPLKLHKHVNNMDFSGIIFIVFGGFLKAQDPKAVVEPQTVVHAWTNIDLRTLC